MRTLLIAIGNTLRGDDGVAHAVAEGLPPLSELAICCVHQLTPELAEEIASYERVIFIDADLAAEQVRIERVETNDSQLPFSHVATPQALVESSAMLYGFKGIAHLCRIPAATFDLAETLTPQAAHFAAQAIDHLTSMLQNGS